MKARAVLLVSLFALAGWASKLAWAGVYPATNPGMPLPALRVIDEQSHTLSLEAALQADGEGPVFFIPVFTKCRMSCPVLIQGMKKALGQFDRSKSLPAIYRVQVLSFDASDTDKDLTDFRAREGVPKNWGLARAADQAEVRAFFDRFSYPIMSEDGGFNHPSQIFVLSRNLKWAGSLVGTELNGTDLADAYANAVTQGRSGYLARAQIALAHPENWVIAGGTGFVASLMLLFTYLARRRAQPSA